jgi:uncharacterized membrane-anchored protein YhcB (DUF1043 family)
MPQTHVKMLLIALFVAVPSAVKAQAQSSPTYTKSEVDAKINELRVLLSGTATKSDLDTRLSTLRSTLDQDAQQADQHLEATRKSLDAVGSNLNQLVDHNEQEDQQRAMKIMEDVAAFKYLDQVSAYFGPLLAAAVGALIGAAVLVLLKRNEDGRRATEGQIEKDRKEAERGQKQIESTLEFSRRFGELLQLQGRLNQAYDRARSTDETRNTPPTALETNEARTWWWLFFDLLLYEYDFFKQDLVWRERFTEWIRWRWYDFKAVGSDVWQTCGIDYQTGWRSWKEKPANRKNRLTQFLDKVHDAPDIASVERIVAEEPLVPHGQYHLGERDQPLASAAVT